MYSSVLSSQQNSRLSQINTAGYSAHPGQFSVRLFKTPTIGSYYATPKYESGYRSTAVPSDYYPSSRYEDPHSRFPPASDPQRSSQYPTPIRTSNTTARDYPARPPNSQSNYTISRGTVNDTYIYEQSDTYSTSEYDDTVTNGSCSPISPAMSTDSTMTLKSPLPSPLTEQDDNTASTRHNPMSSSAAPLPVAGSTTSRSYPPSHEDVLRSGDEAHFRPNQTVGHSNTTITSAPPAATSTSDTRPSGTSATSYTTTTTPPAPAPAPPTSSGYTWHHAIPTIPASDADTEDVSLEARMNAEFNAISTASLYHPPNPNAENTDSSRSGGAIPTAGAVPSSYERSSPPYSTTGPSGGVGRSESTRLHVTVPPAQPDGVPLAVTARSPASSAVVESLEEGRGTSYMHHRNSTVVLGDRDQFLPPFADDRWVGDQERERRPNAISYQRVPVPAPVPELRREYSASASSRSAMSSAGATYHSSPPRQSSLEDQRPLPPPPAVGTATPTSRPRRDSRAGYSAPPPPRPELTRRPSDARDGPPRSSPPRQEEAKLDTSPRRRTESALGLHIEPSASSNRPAGAYAPPTTRPTERRASPPTASSGPMYRSPSTAPTADPYRPQSTAPPEPSYRYTSDSTRARSQSNSPPESHRTPAALSSDDQYRQPPHIHSSSSDPYRSQSGVPYRPQSTAPSSSANVYRSTTSSDPYRAQSTVPPEPPSYRERSSSISASNRQPPATYSGTDAGYPPQANTVSMATMVPPPPSSSSPSSYPLDTRPPTTRPRTNSGSWSRNATTGSTPVLPSSKTPSPPTRHAQAPPRATNSPSSSPPKSSSSPPRDSARGSPQRRSRDAGDDSDYSVDGSKTKPVLTVRNGPPSVTSTDRSSSPPRAQNPTDSGRRHSDAGERQSQNKNAIPAPNSYTTSATTPTAAPARRSTLPYGGQPGINDYGRHTTHAQFVPEQPQRRFSDSDQTDGPSFFFNTGGRSSGAPLARCVRWNENLICPSPVFPSRRKGWFNRKGDQLWTNEGAYKPPAQGNEYPPDLDDYPEWGQGWMNEEGVRIDMTHRLIPKAPLRSALKQPKALV